MKQPSKKQVFISISVLCCFVLGLFHSANLLPAATWDNATSQTQTANVSLAKANLFSPVSPDENIVNGSVTQAHSFHKNQHKSVLSFAGLGKLTQSNCFANYIAWANKSLLSLSSFNIVYPFHYFW